MRFETLIKDNSSILIASAILIASILIGFTIFANAQIENITFPIAELGNCESEDTCRSYCNNPGNAEACTNFALKHNLISEKEARRAKKFARLEVGPGGCTTMQQCKNFCNNINNIDECLAFAESEGFMDDDELIEAKKVAQVLKSGVRLPGGCQNHQSCEAYCNQLENMDECLAFAEQAGLMEQDELEEARKIAAVLKRGVDLPGGCTGMISCEAYCGAPEHFDECIAFAEKEGLMDEHELEEARKMGSLMISGETPGGCQSRESCEAYCGSDLHIDECMAFASKTGFADPEEIERFKATGGRGPGGCNSREECEAFCNNPDNQEICFSFGREHGLINEEDLRRIEEGSRQIREDFTDAPPLVTDCLRNTVGINVIEEIRSGALTPGLQIGERVRGCFEEFGPRHDELPDGEFPDDFRPAGDFNDFRRDGDFIEELRHKLENTDDSQERERLENEIRHFEGGDFNEERSLDFERFIDEVHELPDTIRRPVEEGIDFNRDFIDDFPKPLDSFQEPFQDFPEPEHIQEFPEPEHIQEFPEPEYIQNFSEPTLDPAQECTRSGGTYLFDGTCVLSFPQPIPEPIPEPAPELAPEPAFEPEAEPTVESTDQEPAGSTTTNQEPTTTVTEPTF